MTLVNRVSLFFLAALAACLIGYSAASYWLIRGHLYRQFDGDLQSSLNALVAAVEVEPEEVKWQPAEHTITFGDESTEDDIRWVVTDQRGRIIDHSSNLSVSDKEDELLIRLATVRQEDSAAPDSEQGWRYQQKYLAASDPKSRDEMEPDEAEAMLVTAARSTDSLQANLQGLLLLVCVVPAALWLLAAIAGRSYCRRALAPLEAMAARAQSATTADFQLRLPVSDRHDELSRLAIAFNGLLDQLQTAFESQRRFTGDAAHQLRTPLTVLRGEIEVALRRPRSAEEHAQSLSTLLQQTEALQRIVESLLFLAQIADEAAAPQLHTLDLQTWLANYLQSWQTDPRGPDIHLNVASSLLIRVSPELLTQALDNLLENALKYSSPGDRVTIQATEAKEMVRLVVEDQGIGIAAADRAEIFTPFYRATDARCLGIPGTGLGLALVARIAQAHGGCIIHETNAPRGSRFILQFPRAK